MKRILFVDDDTNILHGIRRTLHAQRRHWDMHFASSGQAALELCESMPFDVIISDMCMPGMDGAALLEKVRDRFPATARLILSGYSELALATRAAPVAYRVLVKPCCGPELQAAIERVCDLQDTFSTPELRQIIGSIGELPSLSATCLELTAALREPLASASSIARILGKDAAMAAKVLQLVNSGFFGFAQTITTLQNAVSYLGIDVLANLALASETFRVLTPNASNPPAFYERAQRHMQRTAIIAGALPLDSKVRETAVIAALLHDIGSLVMASRMPATLCGILALRAECGCTRAEAEQAVLGITHAQIGAYLLGLWGIDPRTVEAVACHHRPTRAAHPTFDASVAVYLADLLERLIESSPSKQLAPDEADHTCLEELGLADRLPEFHSLALRALDRASAA